MPTRKEVHDILKWQGFERQPNDGLENTYTEGQSSNRLGRSWRYQHKNHTRLSGGDVDGAVYVHAFEGTDDAALVANACYREMLQRHRSMASPSGAFTKKTPPEDGYRADFLWRALIVLARETK